MENSMEAMHMGLAVLIFMLSVTLIFRADAMCGEMADYLYGRCGEKIIAEG